MKPVTYAPLTGRDKVQPGDEYNPWNMGWRRLPPSYGWEVRTAPASKFRRPNLSATKIQQMKALL